MSAQALSVSLLTETILPLARAAELVPPARRGRKTHISTLLRWILSGARRPDGEVVRLEAVRLGGRWVTSREAMERFAERLTPRLDSEPTPAPRSPAKQRQGNERAAKELDKVGIRP
jgi:hypothetical protein